MQVTLHTGLAIEIDPKKVVRIRERYVFDGPNGKTRIDWVAPTYVLEPVGTIVSLTKPDLPTLTSLTAPNGDPVWFNCALAAGPEYLVPGDRAANKKSAILLAGKRQVVRETPEQVLDVIKKFGGTPMTIRHDSTIDSTSKPQDWFSPVEDWDPELNIS